MHVTLAQIEDALSACGKHHGKATRVSLAASRDKGFEGIELFEGQPAEPDVLYVMQRDGATRPRAAFAIAAEGGSLASVASADGIGPVSALNAVTRYLMRYSRCLDAMRERYVEHRDLHGLCQELSNFAGNPVVAYDEDIFPIMQVGFTPEESIAYFGSEAISIDWILNEGTGWNVENQDYPLNADEPYRSTSRDGEKSSVTCNIMADGRRCGMLEIYRLDNDITAAHAQLLKQACRIVAAGPDIAEQKFLTRKLQGHQAIKGQDLDWLAAAKWNEGDSVYVMAVHIPSNPGLDTNIGVYLARLLRTQFPNAAHVMIDECLAVVLNERFDRQDAAKEKAESLIARSAAGLHAGMSEAVPGLQTLHERFEHARFAARFAAASDEAAVAFYEKCRFAYLADLCGFAGKRSLIADARVARMHADDLAHGSQSTLTARAFIESGFSLNATAEKLAVHRNTVVYRLKLIRDRYGIDLSAPIRDDELVFHVLLSCKLLLVPR